MDIPSPVATILNLANYLRKLHDKEGPDLGPIPV